MEQYHQRSLQNILRISWKDRCTNISILEEANMTRITTIMQYQLRWTGHAKFHITSSSWKHIALDRSSWKKSVQDGAAIHEIELHHAAEIKRLLRKEKDKKAQPLSTITTLSCPHCTKLCGSRIGLYSHLKSHK